MSSEDLKKQVAKVAVEFVKKNLQPSDILGVGTGSTMNFFVDALAAANVQVRGAISSSESTASRLRSHGIHVLSSTNTERGALYVDGADEVDPSMALIKGGGGAHTREKITAAMCDRFLCIVDNSKLVNKLGDFPLPIEVIPMAQSLVEASITSLGGVARQREGFVTDNGNVILDVHGLSIDHPDDLEDHLNKLPGVVENGVFARNRPFLTLVARPCCVEVRGLQDVLTNYAEELSELELCCTIPASVPS